MAVALVRTTEQRLRISQERGLVRRDPHRVRRDEQASHIRSSAPRADALRRPSDAICQYRAHAARHDRPRGCREQAAGAVRRDDAVGAVGHGDISAQPLRQHPQVAARGVAAESRPRDTGLRHAVAVADFAAHIGRNAALQQTSRGGACRALGLGAEPAAVGDNCRGRRLDGRLGRGCRGSRLATGKSRAAGEYGCQCGAQPWHS